MNWPRVERALLLRIDSLEYVGEKFNSRICAQQLPHVIFESFVEKFSQFLSFLRQKFSNFHISPPIFPIFSLKSHQILQLTVCLSYKQLPKHFSDQLNKNIWVIRWKLFILPGKIISTRNIVVVCRSEKDKVLKTLMKIFLLKQKKNCEWISPLRIKNSWKIYLRKLKFLTRKEKNFYGFSRYNLPIFLFTQTFPKEV